MLQVATLAAELDTARQHVPTELAAQLAQALQHCRPLLSAPDVVAGTSKAQDTRGQAQTWLQAALPVHGNPTIDADADTILGTVYQA